MKITFLGTGAADWPLNKPENTSAFRRFSSALIDDVLLIDPGPQLLDALQELGKNATGIKYIINTHAHNDHFCAETVSQLTDLGATFVAMEAGDQTKVGPYTVRAYKSNHSTCENAVHYIITDDERTVFYGLDGAWLLYDEVQAIKNFKPDLAVFDATIGDVPGDYRIFEHNNLHMVLEMKKTLEPFIKTFCISHMARTLHTDHETLRRTMHEHHIITAYDGLELDI